MNDITHRKAVCGAMHWREVLRRAVVDAPTMEYLKQHRSLRSAWHACTKADILESVVWTVAPHHAALLDFAEKAETELDRKRIYGARKAAFYRKLVPWGHVAHAFFRCRFHHVQRYLDRRIQKEVRCVEHAKRKARGCEECSDARHHVHGLARGYQQRDAGRGIYGRIRVYLRHALDTWREEQAAIGSKTLRDHSSQVGEAPRRWRCSHCGKVDTWTDAWGYWGNLECKRCWMAAIDFVYCSEACKVALEKQHGIDPNDKPFRAGTESHRGRMDAAKGDNVKPLNSTETLALVLQAWDKWKGIHPEHHPQHEGTLLRIAKVLAFDGWVADDKLTDDGLAAVREAIAPAARAGMPLTPEMAMEIVEHVENRSSSLQEWRENTVSALMYVYALAGGPPKE